MRSTAAADSGSSTANTISPDAATSSATVPAAIVRPRWTTTTWVQVCSTSDSRWLETSTVRPVAA